MAVETPGWSGFTGSDEGAGCDVSFPEIDCGGGLSCTNGTTAFATITVSGGVAPYIWSTTKGVIVGSGASVSLYPAANTGYATGSNAVGKCAKHCCVFVSCSGKAWGCNDQLLQACSGTGIASICSACGKGNCSCSSCSGCTGLDCCLGGAAGCMSVHTCQTGGCCGNDTIAGSGCDCLSAHGTVCDIRSGSQISAGCVPCTISMGGGVLVTVEDALGNQSFCTVDVTDPDGMLI